MRGLKRKKLIVFFFNKLKYHFRKTRSMTAAVGKIGSDAFSLAFSLARHNRLPQLKHLLMIGFDPDAVAKLINLPADHMISFLIPVGKKTKPAWDRGPRLPDSTVVIHNRFPA